jgi:DNA (cytosine-5)-methyltransferase 1
MTRGKKTETNLTAVDLFSGCGGLTQGLKNAGYEVLAAVELDEDAARTYSKNHPSVSVFQQDISILSPRVLMRSLNLKAGQLGLLAGCPPCQGFSKLRTRNGAKKNRDRRNGLVHQIVKFAKVLQPKAVMLENVPKLATHSSFKVLQSELRHLGYLVAFRIENAADFGVPQRRRRLIMLATKSVEPKFAAKRSKRKSVRDAIGHLSKPNATRDKLHVSDMSRRSDKVLEIIANIPKNGGSRKSLPTRLQLECHKRKKGFNDVYGRMSWDEVSPTITGGCYNPSKGRFLHPSQNRPITLREAALLQGFPKGYYFDHTLSQQAIALMIGNALPPPFVAKHAKVVAKQLKQVTA